MRLRRLNTAAVHFLMSSCLGSVFSEDRIMNAMDTESFIVVGLMCADIAWWAEMHVAGLVRQGGTVAMARKVVDRARAIGAAVGVTVEDMPKLEEIARAAASDAKG